MIRRSAAVALGIAIQRIYEGRFHDLTADQELCLVALRRSKASLATASNEELGEYIRSLSPESLKGVISNVKGIFHELLVQRQENTDGDGLVANLFTSTNHPGADLEYVMDGNAICEVQLKAVQSPSAILEHFSRYPDIDVLATTEVCAALGDAHADRVTSSNFSNADLTRWTEDSLEAIRPEELGDYVQDGVLTSSLLTGALQARAVLAGQPIDVAKLRSVLGTAGVGLASAVTVDVLLDAI